jgi:hypothetical protein
VVPTAPGPCLLQQCQLDSALDHLESKFEQFWLSGFLKRFSKIFPIEPDVEKCFTLLWPLITPRDHELNKIDSALFKEALL